MLWIKKLSTENMRFWFRTEFGDGVWAFCAILFSRSGLIFIDHV
jgi:hypothetical protein